MIDAILERFGVRPRDPAGFPNVVLTNHRNEMVRFYDDVIRRKLVVIGFMYTRCEGRCPAAIIGLRKLQDSLGRRAGRDVFLHSITLDAAHDTPDVLGRYARTVGAGAGWSFLTGAPDEIDAIRRRLGFVDPNPIVDADKSQHSGMLLLGSESSGRWAACPAATRTDRMVKLLARIEGGSFSREAR